MQLSLIWFRNDLRLKYNRVIQAIFDNRDKVIPIFILDDKILRDKNTSPLRISFLIESLINLDQNLRKYNSSLIVFRGNPIFVFQKILQKNIQIHLYHSKDYTNFAKKRDEEIQKLIFDNKGKVNAIKNLVIFDEEDKLLNQNNNPFKVFTPFRKAWLEKLEKNKNILDFNYQLNEIFDIHNEIIQQLLNFDEVISLKELKSLIIKNKFINGGEDEAQLIWQKFKEEKIYNYHIHRNFLDIDGTSKLSAHLKFGTISPFEIVKFCLNNKDNEGAKTFLSEIIWREFYKYINMYFPYVETGNFNTQFDNIQWEFDKDMFIKWCEGKTGFPIIDACMRCLNETGWMHNRGRMIVGSFLCKDMHIDWRKGEEYFKQKLIDWDKTANNGGWQWVAGTGTDASPYFRIFNPFLQSKKFDPKGNFIRQFVPELKDLPQEFIHEPHKMSLEEQKKHNCILGKDYPFPILDHELERKKALEIYQNTKNF